ncbi:cytochrome P450 [Hyaloraphidium curvatum]|nr:cytochrome P450 [Hyaloraphidium curvatum]
MLGDGIFISDGHAWASSRKIASKLFTVKSFRDVFSRDFVEECDHLSAHLRKAADQGAVVDLQELLLRCTLDSFTRLALGKDPACLSGEGKVVDGRYTLPPSEFMTMFDLFVLLCSVRTIDPLWRFSEVFNGRGRMIAECKRVVHGFASEVIAEKRRANAAKADREKAADDRFDLLDHFMQSRNDDGSDLTDDQLRDAVSNFLLAGRDTTAQTLSWCFWEIAQRPEVAEKLREEALRVLGPDGPTTYESLKDLQYTYCVFQEVLRLHSNVPSMGKIATADTVLPGTGTKVYAGQEVNYSTFAMGYLPEVWGPDAAEFRPERWMLPGGGVMKQNTVKHPVFNSGPRLCLGMNFAQQEATVFLSTLIRRFKFTLVNEDDPEKWGAWNPDPAKRQGRYTEAITLGLRKGVDFALTPLM